MSGQKLNRNWCSVELDEAEPRKRFRRALMKAYSEWVRDQRCSETILTPYWKCDFIDWLLYECTLVPVGCVCTERTDEHCLFEADASGCQTEGICLRVVFDIPTKAFTKKQLDLVRVNGEYYPSNRVRYKGSDGKMHYGFSFGPFQDEKYIRHCEWWYDNSYDENASDGYHDRNEMMEDA